MITNLEKGAFTVLEDGKPQAITSFRHEDIPVAMAVVIDNSGSMREKRQKVNQAALNLVRSSNPQDQVFIVNFNDEYYLDQDFTADINRLKEALEKIEARGGTALYDAVVASADHLKRNTKLERKVLFVVTDGEDNASRESLEQAVRRWQRGAIDACASASVPCKLRMKTVESSRLRVADDITQLVGETPILHFKRLVPRGAADVYAKLEYLNPGGSVKDRAAIGIIRRAEEEGKLRPGGTIVEATAGNTGIGLALIGVNRGYRVALFVPERFSEEKVMIMRALGAEVTRTPDAEGMMGAIEQAKKMAASDPKAFMASQFENPSNPEYHFETTAQEIFEQMEGRIDAMVIGVGTAGTFTGVARYLKQRLPEVLAIAVEMQ